MKNVLLFPSYATAKTVKWYDGMMVERNGKTKAVKESDDLDELFDAGWQIADDDTPKGKGKALDLVAFVKAGKPAKTRWADIPKEREIAAEQGVGGGGKTAVDAKLAKLALADEFPEDGIKAKVTTDEPVREISRAGSVWFTFAFQTSYEGRKILGHCAVPRGLTEEEASEISKGTPFTLHVKTAKLTDGREVTNYEAEFNFD